MALPDELYPVPPEAEVEPGFTVPSVQVPTLANALSKWAVKYSV